MTRRRRLLFVIKSLAVAGGGAERVLVLIASELARRGHDIAIATYDRDDSSDFYPLDHRIERCRLGVGDILTRSSHGEFIGQIAALRRLLQAKRPDVAIGFMHSAFVPLLFAARATRTAVIASEHTAFAHYRRHPLQQLIVRCSARFHAAITATSEAVRSGFPKSIARRMVPIPNPVIEPARSSRPGKRRPRLLCVGGLRPEKSHAILIAAFAKLADRFDWELRLVGDGPLRGVLEQQSGRLGLGNRIAFTGAVADVSSEYAHADLFVLPSTYESFGLATAEALAAGLPAVGFADCPGTNELIRNGVNGLLVDGPDRVTALADGLELLMASPELRKTMSAAAPASVEQYSLASVVDSWERLIEQVIGRKGRRG